MAHRFKAGVCMLAISALFATGAGARHGVQAHATHCAQPKELTAIQTASIQQELMVAALTCNQVENFNAFQTNFSQELRASDKMLMHMFVRLFGGGKGTAQYHAFKTQLANNSEMRSIHGNQDFCAAAGQIFSAALAPIKPALHDFVAGQQMADASPVNSCEATGAAGLQSAMAVPAVVPRPKPAEFADASPAATSAAVPPAAPTVTATGPTSATPTATQ